VGLSDGDRRSLGAYANLIDVEHRRRNRQEWRSHEKEELICRLVFFAAPFLSLIVRFD
jgi:hypothetical protein